ncbi:MAG: TIGR00296 family protein [Nitrososphaerota archaeon]|nr:TIGR00296 family protein [Nitrososphaerota archaeon]
MLRNVYRYTDEEGSFIVKLARRSIEEYLSRGVVIDPPPDTPSKLYAKSGVFVTLNKLVGGVKELRGCIGFPYPTHPLVEATIKAAIESAVGDPRFPPVDIDEMDHIVVEVSLLTPPEEVKVDDPRLLPSAIEIGRDGLIVQRGVYSGLLLPQVPVEQGWDQEEFLSYCCLKAGLPPDAWLLRNTRIYRFRAEVFEEEHPRGSVHRRSLR